MVTIKKFIIGIMVLVYPAYSLGSLNLDFIDKPFDDFMQRINIPENQRVSFQQYYARLTAQLNDVAPADRQIMHGYFYQTALTALQKDHPDWYASLTPFVTDPRLTLDTEINDIRTFVGGFLIRYGAYHEFCTRTVKTVKRASTLSDFYTPLYALSWY